MVGVDVVIVVVGVAIVLAISSKINCFSAFVNGGSDDNDAISDAVSFKGDEAGCNPASEEATGDDNNVKGGIIIFDVPTVVVFATFDFSGDGPNNVLLVCIVAGAPWPGNGDDVGMLPFDFFVDTGAAWTDGDDATDDDFANFLADRC